MALRSSLVSFLFPLSLVPLTSAPAEQLPRELSADAATLPWDLAVSDTVTLVLRSGELVQGRLVAISADTLTLERKGTRGPFYDPVRTVARADVTEALSGIVRPPRARRSSHGYVAAGVQWGRGGTSYRDSWGAGWQIRGGWEPGWLPVPLGWEVGLARIPSREIGLTDLTRFLGGLYWRPRVARFGRWTSHGQVALGAATTSFDRDTFPDAPQTGGTYIGLGAGLGRDVGASSIFVETRYDAVSSGGAPFDFFAVVAGARR